ncbi:hypothetical protein FHR70_001748 [Microvirga lupini]|uniref:Uncharacterized protein n=1 Tax=Microvirga lupini TaxID=420324 RepID=A0A7W4YWZ4_9HYPH|nr:hypothetical protein [Microvirga lupini]MBB3018694.1 hypothetical protein [Microvirga lupini]
MIEGSSFPSAVNPVAVLLHPSAVPVIDVFRSLNRLEDQYDLALLDGPEQGLAAYTRPDTAKGIVSDALLLAFALTRQRGRPFVHKPVGSRHGSLDEYSLLTLIGASRHASSEVALEAARHLEIVSLDFMSALAGELVRQIDLGTVAFDVPSLSDFRAVMGVGASEEVHVEAVLTRAEFNFRHQ